MLGIRSSSLTGGRFYCFPPCPNLRRQGHRLHSGNLNTFTLDRGLPRLASTKHDSDHKRQYRNLSTFSDPALTDNWPRPLNKCIPPTGNDLKGNHNDQHRLSRLERFMGSAQALSKVFNGLEEDYGPSSVDAEQLRAFSVEIKDDVGSELETTVHARDHKKWPKVPASRYIESALKSVDPKHPALPVALKSHHVDFGYSDPMKPSTKQRQQQATVNFEAPRLAAILGKYIKHENCMQTLDTKTHTSPVTTQNEFALNSEQAFCLAKQRFTEEDLKLWTSLITAKSSDAASRVLRDQMDRTSPPIPDFVFMALLRRPHVNASALRIFVDYAKEMMNRDKKDILPQPTVANSSAAKNDKLTASCTKGPLLISAKKTLGMSLGIVLIFIRMLRHARKSCPELISDITQLLRNGLERYYQDQKQWAPSVNQRVTFIYNRALTLLALPTSVRPFAAVLDQQEAQFTLIKSMQSYPQPLMLQREGFRALIRVQAAHRKTTHERKWGELKSPAWPPWKTERTGFDSGVGPEHGISRAGYLLDQARSCGYSALAWEEVARVYAGWDTDGTPAYQTRQFPSSASLRSMPMKLSNSDSTSKPPRQVDRGELVAARIRSTRTLQEAWSIFLSGDDRRGLAQTHSADTYLALLEKVVYERIKQKESTSLFTEKSSKSSTTSLPGDGREVFEAPTSPREATYVSTDPPTENELIERMRSDGTELSSHGLAFLIRNTESIGRGHEYFRSAICKADSAESFSESWSKHLLDGSILSKSPQSVVAAFVGLLCRFSDKPYRSGGVFKDIDKVLYHPRELESTLRFSLNNLFLALGILDAWKTNYRRPWNDVLKSLSRKNARIARKRPGESHEDYCLRNDISSWYIMKEVLTRMKSCDVAPDAQTFRYVCHGLRKAAPAYDALQTRLANKDAVSLHEWTQLEAPSIKDQDGLPTFSALYETQDPRLNLDFAGNLFEDFTGTNLALARTGAEKLSEALDSRMLSVPDPHGLHDYVSLLSGLGSWNGLLALCRWMRRYAKILDKYALSRSARGYERMKRVLTAVRVHVERARLHSGGKAERIWQNKGGHRKEKLEDGVFNEIKDEVSQLVEWGGWPDDEAVNEYIQAGPLRDAK